MTICPVCNHNVKIPVLKNLGGWSRFVCEHCGSRLERMAPRSARLLPFVSIPFMAARVMMIDRHGFWMEILAVGFCVFAAALLTVESLHPRLRLRTNLPEPEIRLNLHYGAD